MKRTRKAFTLVELLVVIAIVGVLATVAIVGYSAYTKKAEVSSDQTTLASFNSHLSGDAVLNSINTPYDAIKALGQEKDFSEDKLVCKVKGAYFVWNQETKQFAYVGAKEDDNKGEIASVEYHNWVFKSVYTEAETKSIYLLKGFSIADGQTLYINKGLDVGFNSNISAVEYSNDVAQDVMIRTNGGLLIVDGVSGEQGTTVTHYGTVNTVKVESVGTHSYREQGIVRGTLYAKEGHVVIEKNVDVAETCSMVVITGANVNVEIKNNTTQVAIDKAVTATANTKLNNVQVTSAVKTLATITTKAQLVEALANGGQYRLDADIELTDVDVVQEARFGQQSLATITSFVVKANVSLDLNGHKITNGRTAMLASGIIMIKRGGHLIVSDSSIVQTGEINGGAKAYAAIALTAVSEDPNGTTKASLTINGGKISGLYYAVTGNGNRHNTEMYINGGHLIGVVSDSTAIYHPQNGFIKVTGGIIEGGNGIYIKSGTLSALSAFDGGTIKGHDTKKEYQYNGNGFDSTGDALVIDNCDYPGGVPIVELSNVTLISDHAAQIGVYYTASANCTGIASVFSTIKFTLNEGCSWQATETTGLYKVVR